MAEHLENEWLLMVPWARPFADGKRVSAGQLIVMKDGRLLVRVDDDYYDGDVLPGDVAKLVGALMNARHAPELQCRSELVDGQRCARVDGHEGHCSFSRTSPKPVQW